jgi:hypothetical protein
VQDRNARRRFSAYERANSIAGSEHGLPSEFQCKLVMRESLTALSVPVAKGCPSEGGIQASRSVAQMIWICPSSGRWNSSSGGPSFSRSIALLTSLLRISLA